MNKFQIKSLITPILLLAVLFITTGSMTAQDAAAADAGHSKSDVTFFHIFIDFSDGGHAAKAIVMWALLAMSCLMFSFIIEMFIKLRKAHLLPDALYASLKDMFAQSNYVQAYEICRNDKTFLGKVVAAGLERINSGKSGCYEALADTIMSETSRIKAKNNYLSVIGVISPMVGLTGTVLGMMQAFAVLGQAGVANMTGLSSAISAVLIATAAGLIVAIPAFVFFYFFKNRETIVTTEAKTLIKVLFKDVPFDQIKGMDVLGMGAGAQSAAGYPQGPAGYAPGGYQPQPSYTPNHS